MESAGLWVGIAGLLTAIGTGVAWVFTWYIQYRKQKMTEVQTLNVERREDEKTSFQRLSELFDSERRNRRRLGRVVAKVRKQSNDAEVRRAVCEERLANAEVRLSRLEQESIQNQKEQLRKLDVLIGETKEQTAEVKVQSQLQMEHALDKIIQPAVSKTHDNFDRKEPYDADETTRGK